MATMRPVTPEFYDRAPTRYRVERVVAATPDEVFTALADTPGWPQWFPAIRAARWTSEPPHGVGSTRSVDVGPITFDEEFIVWEPGRAWGFTIVGTTVPLARAAAELVELEPDGTGTRVTYRMCVEPYPLLGFTGPLLRGGVEKGLHQGLKGLERHLAGD